jgi:F-type H+-transporting ATPase subunit delta
LIPGSVAKRYARALVEAAASPGELERVGGDLRALSDLFRDHRDLRVFLANPSVSRRVAGDVIADVVAALRLCPLTTAFLRIVLDAGRLAGLEGILRAFERLADDRLGRVRALVTTAAPLDADAQAALRRRLGEVTGKDVYLDIRQDPALLGGVVARIGSRVFDGSLKTQLARLRDEMARA